MAGIGALPGGGIEDGLLCSSDGFSFGWDRDNCGSPGADTTEAVSLLKFGASWCTKQSCISGGGFGNEQTIGTGEEVPISAGGNSVADLSAGWDESSPPSLLLATGCSGAATATKLREG